MYQELLIGCGSDRTKKMTVNGSYEWKSLTTLDYNADHKPDVVWDLMLPRVLPFDDNMFDEIHAYDVLEHLGQQGDYRLFFQQFTRFWEVLKPNGHVLAICPSRHSPWAWGDPSHTRVLQKEQLIFLRQSSYDAVGSTPISDFRSIYKANFEIMLAEEDEDRLVFILKAIK
jgi:SAM-dependent methyltransferase